MSHRWPYPAGKKHLSPMTAQRSWDDYYKADTPQPKGRHRAQ